MARAVLRREGSGSGWELSCPRELEASIYLQAMTLNLWPRYEALAQELGYAYEAIPGTGHLLQIQKPEECRRAMLTFLDEQGIRY